MQSWGLQSHFTHRDTGLEPSKSGVIGLLCAALGKPRDESYPDNAGKPSLERLAALQMGVRVDREGLVKKDYHTAMDVMTASGKPFKNPKPTELSDRFYLADAAFLVGLADDDNDLLAMLYSGLQRPVWILYLGRKAFVPGAPVWLPDGLKPDQDLKTALCLYRRIAQPRAVRHGKEADHRARLMMEDPVQGSIVRPDQPISFRKGSRQFTVRRLSADFCIPYEQGNGSELNEVRLEENPQSPEEV
jgi:CRISPR system Cascade subunit CasD